MDILFYFIILGIFILSILLAKESKLSIFMTLFCSLLIIKIVLNPNLCINATLNGAKLFFNSVFVSLFPFLVITNIMMEFGGIKIYSKLLGNILCKPLRLPKQCSFPILVSFVCGYPLGAKYSCELYERNLIDLDTCERLLNIASNASPLFVIGAVGASMLNNHYLGYLLLISNCLSSVFMALIIKNKGHKSPLHTIASNKKVFKQENVGKILKRSIENSIYTTLSIGGFIVLFSVFISLLKNDIVFLNITKWISNVLNIPNTLLNGLLIGIIEMTNGCHTITYLPLNMLSKLVILSFFISFGGFSITSQVYSFTYKYNISMKKYLRRKVVQGSVSSIITFILYKLFYNRVVFTSTFYYDSSFYNIYSLKSLIILILLTIFIYICTCIVKKVKELFSIS